MASSSSSSGSNNSWNYGVFLSFSGGDTRNTFTGHLYQALCDKGINVFIDNELRRGEVITSQLLSIIEASRISIAILSEKYPSSSFCLDELVKILECRESKGQTVYPVFYYVDPFEVEKQIGNFGKEFAMLEAQLNNEFNYWRMFPAKAASFSRYVLGNFKEMSMRYIGPISERVAEEEHRDNEEEAMGSMEMVQKWKTALTEVARLSGWHLIKGNHEATTIRSIVKAVLKELDHHPMDVAEHPVGLDSRVDRILEDLELESDDVRMLGLQGMGGIGKTTTAKAIYNKCFSQYEFDGCCFLLNVRENSRKRDLAKLQEALLYEILGDKKRLMGNFDKGINILKERLSGKKVLIVIDDVDHIKQLQKLAGGLEWFGPGSRIIITTRDLNLLTRHGVTMIHEIKELEGDEAMELFCWHAFREVRPSEPFAELTEQILTYCQGLPLALGVVGSSLRGRDVPMWEDMLKKLKRCPHNEITEVLKVSYDALDSEQQSIFLDLACFVKGNVKNEVIKFLDACDFSAELDVQILIEKSLIYVDCGELEMHDLLQAMGIQIAMEESARSPPGRRLCIEEHIPHFLEEQVCISERTCDIEGILLDFHGEEEVHLNQLESMKKLRVLIIRNGRISKMPERLPENLRWLEWRNCSLKTVQPGFLPPKLIVLELPSNFMSLDKAFAVQSEGMKFMDLTHMDFRSCEYLSGTFEFSSIPNLELLNLSACENLQNIDESIGNLQNLKYLYLHKCPSLVSLPDFMGTRSLVDFTVHYCPKLEKLPSLPTNLSHLWLSESGIKEIPSSIADMHDLLFLNASSCQNLARIPDTILQLPRLKYLNLSNCSKLAEFLQTDHSVTSSDSFSDQATSNQDEADLYLSGTNFVTLPADIFRFSRLTHLYLDNCKFLVEIPELPHTLIRLSACNCESLERFLQFRNNFEGDFTNCHKLAEKGTQSLSRLVLQNLLLLSREENPRVAYSIKLPGTKILEWFSYTQGNSSSLKLPPPGINLTGIAACAIFHENPETDTRGRSFRNQLSINNFSLTSKGSAAEFFRMVPPPETEHMWLFFCSDPHLQTLSSEAQEFWCEFNCEPDDAVVYRRCGVHYIYKDEMFLSY